MNVVLTEVECTVYHLRGTVYQRFTSRSFRADSMWGRITRILLGFGLLCIIFAFTVPRFSTPSRIFSDSSPPSPRGDHFCKFRQRVNVILSDRTGSARGIICTDSAVEAFLGIPYAKPPVGPLRFNAPATLEGKSSRVFEGSKFGKTCLQQTVRSISLYR